MSIYVTLGIEVGLAIGEEGFRAAEFESEDPGRGVVYVEVGLRLGNGDLAWEKKDVVTAETLM
jgi:hypothetical protein